MTATSHLRKLGPTLCLIAGMAAFGSGFAQAGGIEIATSVFQEIDVKAADGTITRKLVPATKVVPGGEVVYEITFRNNGSQAATDVNIDNPLPRQLVYAGADSEPTAVSVDGGSSYGPLATLTVRGPEGATRPARPSDVTHLRWTIATLAPGAKGDVMFRAVVK